MTAGEVQRAEEELIARARHGDREAFGDLVGRYQDTVYTLALRLVGPDLAADVAQEALLRAWRALPRFRGEAALRHLAAPHHREHGLDAAPARRSATTTEPLERRPRGSRPCGPSGPGELAEVRAGLRSGDRQP